MTVNLGKCLFVRSAKGGSAFLIVAALLGCTTPSEAEERQTDARIEQAIVRADHVRIVVRGEPISVTGTLVPSQEGRITVLRDGNLRTVDLGDVITIDRIGDGLGNGLILGALVGGAWCAHVCGQATDGGGMYVSAVLVNAAVGSLIGAMIDSSHKGVSNVYRSARTIRFGATSTRRAFSFVGVVSW